MVRVTCVDVFYTAQHVSDGFKNIFNPHVPHIGDIITTLATTGVSMYEVHELKYARSQS